MDRYQLEQRVGIGSSAMVFKAVDKKYDCFVAVKHFSKEDKDAYTSYRIECKVFRTLPKHPNIVRCLRYFQLDHAAIIVLEYLPRTLQWCLDEAGKRSEKRSLDLLRQIMSGVQHMHAHQFVHCDIKPSNILIGQQRDETLLKLCDFGLSKQSGGSEITDYVQTRWYRAPERVLCEPICFANDWWSVGCIFYQLLTGVPLFAATSEAELLAWHMMEAGSDLVYSRPYRLIAVYVDAHSQQLLDWFKEQFGADIPRPYLPLMSVHQRPPRLPSLLSQLQLPAQKLLQRLLHPLPEFRNRID